CLRCVYQITPCGNRCVGPVADPVVTDLATAVSRSNRADRLLAARVGGGSATARLAPQAAVQLAEVGPGAHPGTTRPTTARPPPAAAATAAAAAGAARARGAARAARPRAAHALLDHGEDLVGDAAPLSALGAEQRADAGADAASSDGNELIGGHDIERA